MIPFRLWLCLRVQVLLFSACCVGVVSNSRAASDRLSQDQALLRSLHLPAPFIQVITDRALVDDYQSGHYQVQPSLAPAPQKSFPARGRQGSFVRVLQSAVDEDAARYRATFPQTMLPIRGYRAPILAQITNQPPALYATNLLSPSQRAAAHCIAFELAPLGLLPTLVKTVGILGPSVAWSNPDAIAAVLGELGFPVDLLACFQPGATASQAAAPPSPHSVIQWVATRLLEGASAQTLLEELAALPFQWKNAGALFEVATESGEHELGLLRLQAGGGYRDGLIPGGSIDLICQIVAAFPHADYLISMPADVVEPFEFLAKTGWRLFRPNQVTLIGEPSFVSAWAQDNGKSGSIEDPPSHPKPATLTPRYASTDEGVSMFRPGESFLMDGLHNTGHAVVQSALLFQGGNLVPVQDPASGRRLLLLGEGEVYRNIALGLSFNQVLAAFQSEFAVDQCALVPATSYHLDFDVSLRAHRGRLVALVNDNLAASRQILQLGIDALERAGALSRDAAHTARANLQSGHDAQVARHLAIVVHQLRGALPQFPTSLANAFVTTTVDSAAGNLQTFLLALDFLESTLTPDPNPKQNPDRARYLMALRRFEIARQQQAARLAELGFRVVPIPSMTDLYRGINYLNGLQHARGYVMPVFGGFYATLDQAVLDAIRKAFDGELEIIPILSAECQRQHGGIHCTVSAYPKLPPKKS